MTEMCWEMLASVLPYPSSDAVVASIISVSNQSVLSSALSKEYEKITLNYQNNGGIAVSELKKEYSLLYHAYLASLTCGYGKVLAVAKENSYKDALQIHYSAYESKLTYQKYLKSCLADANAHWTAAVENGEASIQVCRLGSTGAVTRAGSTEGIKEPWCSRGLRVMPVDNYLVFYIPNKDAGIVTVIRVMYAGRDVDRQLNDYTVM